MVLTHRLVKEPSVLNRALPGSVVVPKYPNISQYETKVFGGMDRREFEDVLYASEHDILMRATTSSILPKEIGYVARVGTKAYAVPYGRLKGFMLNNGVTKTEPNDYGLWAEIVGSKLVVHGNPPTVETAEIIFIYSPDVRVHVKARLPIGHSFRVQSKCGVQRIVPKGDAYVYGLHLQHEELLPILKGKIVDVSRFNRYYI